MVVVIGGGGMVWAACQLDLRLSWVTGKAWARKRQNVCVCVRERERKRQGKASRHP